jgi:hypothetical protein
MAMEKSRKKPNMLVHCQSFLLFGGGGLLVLVFVNNGRSCPAAAGGSLASGGSGVLPSVVGLG